MKMLALLSALFLSVPAVEAAPRRPIPGLQQGGPVAKVRAVRQRIKQKIQARRAARAAQAQQAKVIQN